MAVFISDAQNDLTNVEQMLSINKGFPLMLSDSDEWCASFLVPKTCFSSTTSGHRATTRPTDYPLEKALLAAQLSKQENDIKLTKLLVNGLC